ncbi:hypothetical protein MNBD_NITROSPINAE02-2049 [hydrothermal vent metagenome]|uniref:Zinc finger/thioredoxin putative domain-containing protein n=1 Tax=hydrothermal vent metagenome TaxID=652676 RepID=A0A3B1D0M0_9ZZZZ
MKIVCPKCHKRLNIPDGKVPEDRDVSIKCPNCDNPITISKSVKAPVLTNMPTFEGLPDSTPRPKEFMDKTQTVASTRPQRESARDIKAAAEALEDEMEILAEGSLRVLVADTENLEFISPILKKMNYLISAVGSVDEAITKLQFNFYNLIILNERFDNSDPKNNAAHKYIEDLKMDDRRRMFVALIGKNFKTLDNMTAFTKSVNLVVNVSDFSNFELILKKAMNDNDSFYRTFKKLLVDTGRELEI